MDQKPQNEVGLIEALARIFGPPPAPVVVGIGDDCAVIAPPVDRQLIWTVDTLVEGVHFDLALVTLRQVGVKTMAVNVSDLAAMGGEAAYALLSLSWPPHRDLAQALELGQGLAAAGRKYGVTVIGGDSVASPAGITVTLTVLGWGNPGKILRRATARAGDRIYVTGPLGESAAGLEVLRRGLKLDPAVAGPLIQAHVNPRPQVQAGRLLANEGLATAAIDLSDGVASDLAHICTASRVGAIIEAAAVPISAAVREVARLLDLDPLDLALGGGEDYQLLFTCPPELGGRLEEAFAAAGLPIPVRMGEMVPGQGVILRRAEGDRDISGRGFDHFRLDRP
jgi:thiamine-monophosphate kinase